MVALKSGTLIVVYNPLLESIRREQYYEHSEDEDTVERAFRQMKGIISLGR